MTNVEGSTSHPPLPRWYGPRASADDPAVSALIHRVAAGAGWADLGGGCNLNDRIDAEPPLVLRVHRPWVHRGRVAAPAGAAPAHAGPCRSADPDYWTRCPESRRPLG